LHRIRRFSVWKRGNSSDENEDAIGLAEDERILALSDGATEGAFSRSWAEWLVGRFIIATVDDPSFERTRDHAAYERWVHMALQEWAAQAVSDAEDRSVPWYVERARAQGGFATLLGVRITDVSCDGVPALSWTAVATGDTCLFHCRGNDIVRQLPSLLTTTAFTISPQLLSSAGSRNEEALEATVFAEGIAFQGDCLLLVSDALAAWIVQACEGQAHGPAIRRLREITSEEDFSRLIDRERESRTLKNDDCTLVIIEPAGEPAG
jgi:hypothetical protein